MNNDKLFTCPDCFALMTLAKVGKNTICSHCGSIISPGEDLRQFIPGSQTFSSPSKTMPNKHSQRSKR